MPLPPTLYNWDAAARGEEALIPAKFDKYTNAAAYGITLNDEGRNFLEAVARGFVPKTPAGLETFLAWVSKSTADVLKAGLLDWFAFRVRFVSKLSASAASAYIGAAAQYGVSPAALQQALTAMYGSPIAAPPPPPSATLPQPTAPGPVVYTTPGQVQVRGDPIGDGSHFVLLATRTMKYIPGKPGLGFQPTSGWRKAPAGLVVSFAGGIGENEAVKIVTVDDVRQGTPAAMWDYPGFVAALGGSATTPPDNPGNIGQVTPTMIPIPSGSIPIPDAFQPPGGTPLLPPFEPAVGTRGMVGGAGGGVIATTAPNVNVGPVPMPPQSPLVDTGQEPTPQSGSGGGWLLPLLGIGAVLLLSRKRGRR